MTQIKEIPGHPQYGADEEGNIWSFKPCRTLPSPRMMKLMTNKSNGYAMVMITIDSLRFNRTVHRLIAQTFLGEAPAKGYEVTHLNGNRKDNRVSNLAWVTHNAARKRADYPKNRSSARTPDFNPDEIVEVFDNDRKEKIFPIPGFAGYGADRHGNIWRTKPHWRIGRKPNKMSPYMGNNGYPVIGLSFGNKRIIRSVHQLITLTFHGEPPSKDHQVCHWDGNKLNNRPENLRWGTRTENAADTKRLDRYNKSARKFTPEQIREIRQSDRGMRYWAKKLDCSQSTILQIRRRNTYADVI